MISLIEWANMMFYRNRTLLCRLHTYFWAVIMSEQGIGCPEKRLKGVLWPTHVDTNCFSCLLSLCPPYSNLTQWHNQFHCSTKSAAIHRCLPGPSLVLCTGLLNWMWTWWGLSLHPLGFEWVAAISQDMALVLIHYLDQHSRDIYLTSLLWQPLPWSYGAS